MISELLPEEKRKLHELEQQLVELEHGNMTIQASDVYMGVKEMSFRLDELEKLVGKEPKARREDFKRRVQHLKNTHAHINSSLESLVRRKARHDYDSQRKELFGDGTIDNLNRGDIELQMAEGGSLERSNRMMSEYLAVGQDTLSNLFSQRERLKGVQRKAFDILNYLGIANNIMKYVEGRDLTDKWIVFIGMILILVLIFYVWFYLVK